MATTTATGSMSPTQRIDYASILSKREKFIILAGVLLGLFLAALDQTIVATALPAIVSDLQGLDQLAWISTGYLLASTAMVPIYGKLSDLYGRKIIVLWGIVVFLLGSVLCGLSNSMLQLIAFRVVQGIGAAALTSTAFAIPADLFAPAERARYMGLFGAVFGLSSVIGPYLGGLLTDTLSWHWVFFVNLPVGIIALAFVLFKMPRLASGLRAPIDWFGTITLIIAVVPLLLALTLDKTLYAWTSPLILGLFGVAAIGIALFALAEMRAPSPIISFDLFRNRTFAVIIGTSILLGSTFFGAVLFLSLFMVNVIGVSATAAGTALIPLTLSLVVGSIISSAIVQRIGRYRPIILIGFAIMLVGFFLLWQMDATTTRWGVTWRMIVLGMGIGPAMPLLNLAMQNAVPFDKVGSATANRQFFQQLGQAFGAALFGVVLSTTLTAQITQNMAPIIAELPPSVQSQFDPAQFRSSGEGASSEQADIGVRITGEVQNQFAQQRTLITAALQQNDPQAANALIANPQTPAQLKDVLQASVAGKLSPEAHEQALQGALAGLDAAEQQALNDSQRIADQIAQAIKQSFATAVTRIYWYCIWLVVIAVVVIGLLLPEIPLRTSNRPDTPPVME